MHCRSAECEADSREWLREVAELVGAAPWQVLQDPLTWLADYLETEVRTDHGPTSLPSTAEAEITGWRSRLWTRRSALKYLRVKRGLTHKTIRDAELGYDGSAFVIPIRNAAGEAANVVRRRWPQETEVKYKYKAMSGRNQRNGGVQLYPDVPPEGPILLCEGLLDALLGRQEGLPVVTSTHGVSTFLDGWLPLMRGRRVAVMYDIGVEEVMHRRVVQLRAAGADAWPVELRRLLRPGEGKDLSDALTGNYTAQDIIRLVRRERRRAVMTA